MPRTPASELWRRWTEPHPSVQLPSLRRRARLAANLLVILLAVSPVIVGIYTSPAMPGGGPFGATLAIGVFAAFAVAHFLVRGPHPRRGILLLVLAPAVAILAAFPTSLERPMLAYFSIVPVLLGALLLDFRSAFLFAAVNFLGVGVLVAVSATSDPTAPLLGALLFLGATSAIVISGSAFMERSVREAEAAIDRLRQADTFRMRLLNTVVHDLNTPLTPIALQVALLERIPGQEKRSAILRRNVAMLQTLVTDIADLAKIEGGHLRLYRDTVDLAEIARAAAEDIRGKADHKRIKVIVDAVPCLVQGDEGRLTQVFHNLLTNAIKFTPEGGRVHVEVHPGPTPTVRVRDNGRGLDAGEVSRLFQPFTQVHDPSETTERGTGLGLYITKSIVEAHGGTAWVESAGRGMGSVFTFSIPDAASAGAKGTETTESRPDAGAARGRPSP